MTPLAVNVSKKRGVGWVGNGNRRGGSDLQNLNCEADCDTDDSHSD